MDIIILILNSYSKIIEVKVRYMSSVVFVYLFWGVE